MADTKPTPAAGDPCPNCGGAFKKAYQPTEAERAAALNRENPIPLRTGADTATAAQVKELGELHTCRECGYQTRVKGSDASSGQARTADRPADRSTGGAADDGHTQRIADLERQLAEARGDRPGA